MAKKKIMHGARVKVIFDGKQIGILTTVTENEDYGLQPIYGIGEFTPQEILAMRFSGDFNYTKLVVASEKIKDLKLAERTGKSVPSIVREIMTQKGFTIVIEDKYTKENIATITECKMGSISLTVTENALLQQSGRGSYGAPVETP